MSSPGRGMEMPRRTAPPNDATRVAHVENMKKFVCVAV